MRLLFVKDQLSYPRSSGHDVHGFYLMQALARLGHSVSLATAGPVDPRAVEGGGLERLYRFDAPPAGEPPAVRLRPWEAKFARYWGVSDATIRQVGAIAEESGADAVAAVGLHVLPYLGAVHRARRVWYAGDEWVWHHLSQVAWRRRGTWGEVKEGLIKGLYEWSYRHRCDRVWMVSAKDRTAYRWVCGRNNVDVLPNGIDADHYRPLPAGEVGGVIPNSCVFWGRLDFGPNVQAIEWFAREVWPRVRERVPDATCDLFGFQLTDAVRRVAERSPGVGVTPDLPDLRREVQRRGVVVLPFVSGGGIKNKLLEAAAMARPIVCTPRTVEGLRPRGGVRVARDAGQWVRALTELWGDRAAAERLGQRARQWVTREHTWAAAAERAVGGLQRVGG